MNLASSVRWIFIAVVDTIIQLSVSLRLPEILWRIRFARIKTTEWSCCFDGSVLNCGTKRSTDISIYNCEFSQCQDPPQRKRDDATLNETLAYIRLCKYSTWLFTGSKVGKWFRLSKNDVLSPDMANELIIPWFDDRYSSVLPRYAYTLNSSVDFEMQSTIQNIYMSNKKGEMMAPKMGLKKKRTRYQQIWICLYNFGMKLSKLLAYINIIWMSLTLFKRPQLCDPFVRTKSTTITTKSFERIQQNDYRMEKIYGNRWNFLVSIKSTSRMQQTSRKKFSLSKSIDFLFLFSSFEFVFFLLGLHFSKTWNDRNSSHTKVTKRTHEKENKVMIEKDSQVLNEKLKQKQQSQQNKKKSGQTNSKCTRSSRV